MTDMHYLIESSTLFEKGDASALSTITTILKKHADVYLIDINNKDSLFCSDPEFLKQLLDQYATLFERLYFDYSDMSLNPTALAMHSGHSLMELPIHLDLDEIKKQYQLTLDTNQEYLSRHPDTDWKGDYETGRIWSREFKNEGRKRGFWFNSEKAPNCFIQLMNDSGVVDKVSHYAQAPVQCEYMLCEELSPTSFYFQKRDWHMDKLRDQVKVFIPVEDVNDANGAPYFIENTQPESLFFKNEQRQHLHFAFIFSAMHTSNNNFIRTDDPLLKSHATRGAFMKKGQMFLLDTRVLHSGSLCQPGNIRKTITLTFRVDSRRNKLLSHLKSFY